MATNIVNEVISAVKEWKSLATKLSIAKREMDIFEPRFEKGLAL